MNGTTGTSRLFWIKGNPGTGKSVLIKHIATRTHERNLCDVVVSFFFHGQGTPLQKNLLGLFRALLASILKYFPEHLTELAAKFAEREKQYGRDLTKPRWEWTENELRALLSGVLVNGTHRQPVIIFIDALDECGEDAATSLLAYFRDLADRTESGNARFKICFSSRHYPILGHDLIPSIEVEKMNGEDIRWYVKKRLKDIPLESKRQKIESEILSKSNGGFQWVFLVTSTIVIKDSRGTGETKLLEELTNCPQTLSNTYEVILRQVPATEQHQMMKIFQWVLFAERPLSAQELRHALATDKEMYYRSIHDLRSYEGWSDTMDDFENHVKYISRGLVRFQSREIWERYEPNGEDSDREAQLIHQSVADFLMHESGNIFGNHLPTAQSFAGSSHLQISRSCLRYMTLDDILESTHLPRGTLSSRFPLAPYVVRFLFVHIMKVEQKGIIQSDLLSVLQWAPNSEIMRKLLALWRTLDPDSVHKPLGWPFVGATALHVLVAFGSMSAVNMLLDSGCDEIYSKDATGNTPLMLSIIEGHQDIALALLDRMIEREGRDRQHDADGQHRETHFPVAPAAAINAQNEDGDTGLNIALDQNMGEVILKLIEAGADLKYLGRETALVAHAVSSRNTKLLSILIEKKINLDGTVFFALTDQLPQQDSVLEGIISQLLNAGANTTRSLELIDLLQPEDDDDEDNGSYDTDALALASRRGLTNVVEMLLEHNAWAALQNNLGQRPLLIATQEGHEDIIRMLILQAPSSIEMADHDGDTALSIASRKGLTRVVEMLLEHGAPAALQNNHGECPLLIATEGGHENIVQMLVLKAPSSVEIADHNGDTALSIAGEYDRIEIAKLLLQEGSFSTFSPATNQSFLHFSLNGATHIIRRMLQRKLVDLESAPDGHAPLSLAAQNGHAAVVKQLLDTGKVDPDLAHSGITPLSLAAQNGYAAVVKQLLNTDKVNPDLADNGGRTPLSWAAENGRNTVVKELLDTGKVNLNTKDKYGWAPLFWAVWNGNEAVVNLLLRGDHIDVDAKDINGTTPLLRAVQKGCKKIVSSLLETGKADMFNKDTDGWTPVSWATRHGDEPMVELLQAYVPRPTTTPPGDTS
jgi:ankyrin repeat protein/predicted ATPase